MKASSVLFLLIATSATAVPLSFNDAINKFSLDLYQKCSDEQTGNVILSPYSLATVMSLIAMGADGNTFDQIVTVMNLDADKNGLAEHFGDSVMELKREIGNSSLDLANKIYVQNNLDLNAKFVELSKNNFDSEVELIDFQNDQSYAVVNNWIENKTNDRIKNLFLPNSLSSDASVVLINAIYFKARWEKHFDVEKTHKAPFWINQNESIEIDFMEQKNSFRSGIIDKLNATVLEMEFQDSDLSFLILLPAVREGIHELEQHLNELNLNELDRNLHKNDVVVKLPKFKFEFRTELQDTLMNLGIIDAFSAKANFRSMIQSNQQLQISKIIHKAFIEVNEEGAEAAAATGGVLRKRTRPKSERITIDHPFIHIIRTKSKILFIGRTKTF